MKITIDNKDYELNISRAIEAGYLRRLATPIRFEHLKEGDVFTFKSASGNWSNEVFVMLDSSSRIAGQCVSATTGQKTYFLPSEATVYRVLKECERWEETIKD